MLELSPSRNANLLALSALLGICGTLVLVWEAGAGIGATAGPSALASSADAVYFVAADTLYQADADGRLHDAVPLATLGIDGVVAELAVLEDAVLVADGDSGALHRCTIAQRACTRLTTLGTSPEGSALALGVAAEAGRLYVAETGRHQLYAHDLSGQRLYRLAIDGGLLYPNEVLWLGDGRLLVADTNHHRLLIVQDEGQGRTRVLQQIDVKNSLGRGNTWPTAAAQDSDGNTWAINSDGLLRSGEVIVYAADGKPLQHIDLGAAADPMVLAPVANGMLLADYDNYRLQHVGLDYRVSAFGDAALRGALQQLHGRRDHWQQVHDFSIGMMVLFGLIGAAAVWLDAKARRARAPAQRQPGVVLHPGVTARQCVADAAAQLALRPDAQGITWVPPNIKELRRFQALIGLLTLGLVMLPAMMFFTRESIASELLLLPAGLAVFVAVIFWALFRGFRRLRLGTDGERLHVVDIWGRQGQGAPEEFVHTGRRLLLGRIGVPLPNQRLALFDKAAFAAVIEPLLERTPRSNEFVIAWRDLCRGDPLAWSGVIAAIALIALRIWLER